MCTTCGARSFPEHEQWVMTFYVDRRDFWVRQGKDQPLAVRLAMLDVEQLEGQE